MTSLCGWVLLYESAFYLQKVKGVNKILTIIGQNTLSVVILHFLSFKLMNYIYCILYDKPLSFISIFPVSVSGGYWWLAYAAIGVGLPVCLNCIRKKGLALILKLSNSELK